MKKIPPDLAQAIRDERWRDALRIAARYPRLGAHREAITRGHQAATRPDFYRQLGQDPEARVAAGIAALKERYV